MVRAFVKIYKANIKRSEFRKKLSAYMVWIDIHLSRPINGLFLKIIYANDSNWKENKIGNRNINQKNNITNSIAKKLISDGYLVLNYFFNQNIIDLIDKKVKSIFETEKDTLHLGYQFIDDPEKKIPEIKNLLNEELRKIFDSYYRNGWEIMYYRIWRNIHWENENIDYNSNIWHFDQARTDILKMFVLLTPLEFNKNGGGATLVKSFPDTKKIVRNGFISRWIILPSAKRLLNEFSSTRVMNGNKGFTYIFNPQLCLHKATSVKPNHYRDVLLIQVCGKIKF